MTANIIPFGKKPADTRPDPSQANSRQRAVIMLNTLIKAITDKDKLLLRRVLIVIGEDVCPAFSVPGHTDFCARESNLAIREARRARFALLHPKEASESALGKDALKLGKNVEFAVQVFDTRPRK